MEQEIIRKQGDCLKRIPLCTGTSRYNLTENITGFVERMMGDVKIMPGCTI